MAESSSEEPLREELKGQGLPDTVVTALIQYGLSSLQDLQFFTEEDFHHLKETHGLKPFQVQQLRCLQKKLPQTWKTYGGTKQNLFFLFRLPNSTLQYIVKETCEIIYETLQETQLKFPSSEVEWAAIQQLFLQKWNFPQCLGALDGKHIRIKCPPKGGSMYFNYMHFHSIVLLALVDADYKFVFVDVGAPGRFGDATIWNHSALQEHLEGETLNAPAAMLLPENDVPIPSLIVADAAFALSARVMKPFPDRNMTREERVFNYRLSRARRVVENAFGILAARFGVLQSAMSTHPDTVVKTVQACVVLHNFLRRMGDSKYTGAGMVDTERGPNHELLQGEWRHNASAQLPGLQPVVGGSRHGSTFNDGKAVRNALKNYFIHQGALHWQGGQAGSRPGIVMQDVHVTVDTMHSHSRVFGSKAVVAAGEGGQAAAPTPVQASLSHSSLQVGTVGPGSSVALQNISMAPSELREKLENLIATTRQEMNTHCPHLYVETPALQKVLDCLHKPGVCLILGLPGHGKSSLALQAMARLASTENFLPVHLTDPSQWNWIPPPETRNRSVQSRMAGNDAENLRHDAHTSSRSSADDTDSPSSSEKCKLSRNREQKPMPSQQNGSPTQETQSRQSSDLSDPPQEQKTYVTLIDDSFGKGNFDQRNYNGWEDKFSHLEAKVRDGQVKLILVSRTHIYQNCKDSLVQHSLFALTEKVDLNDQKLWSEKCLESILSSFLSYHNLELPLSSLYMYHIWRSCQNIGFPQCCFYFVTNEEARKSGMKFFEKPLKFLRQQFLTMQKNDRKSYVVLILTLMEEGSISLVPPFSARLQSNLERIRGFIATDNVTLLELNEVASSLVNVYLSRGSTPGSFRFCHQTVWDCLVLVMFETDFESTIEACSVQQLSEYIRTSITDYDQADFIYLVQEAQWPLLAARLVREMTSGNLKTALNHPCIKDKSLRRELESLCSEPSLTRQILLREFNVNLKFSLPAYDQVICAKRKLDFLIDHYTAVGEIVRYLPSLARKLIESDTFRDLPVPKKDLILKEAVESACLKSDWELIQILVEKETFVTGRAVFAAASSSLSEDKIEQLIHRMAAEPCEYQLLLFHALSVDRLTIFHCLMSCLSQTFSNIQCHTLRGENFLHVTASCKSTGILQHLLEIFPAEMRPQWVNITDVEGSTPLHRALETGCYTVILLLLNYGASVNIADRLGRFPLHVSASIKTNINDTRHSHTAYEESLKKLIEMTQDVNSEDNSGSIPLRASLQMGNTTLASLLVHSDKADVDLADVTHRTALHWCVLRWETLIIHSSNKDQACQATEPSSLLTAIVSKTNDINRADDKGQRPLLTALREGHADAADILLTHGADPNLPDSSTQGNALHWCIEGWNNMTRKNEKEKRFALLNKIIAETMDVDTKDAEGNSPFQMALNQYCHEVVAVLLEHISGISTKQQSSKAHMDALFECLFCPGILNLLFSQGLLESISLETMSDLTDSTGRTLLHFLCENEKMMKRSQQIDVAWVKILAERSSGILNKQDQEGNSALHVAAEKPCYDLMRCLLQHGASTELVDGQGRTALHILAGRPFDSENWPKDRELWEKMLTSSNIDIQDHHGRTALHIAAMFGNTALLKMLVDKGGKTDLQEDNGQTALCCLFHFLFPQIDKKCFIEVLRWKQLLSTVTFRDIQENNDHPARWTQLVLAYLACCHWNKMRRELVDASGQTALHFLVGVCHEDSTGVQLTPVTREWDDECKELWKQLSSWVLYLVNHQSSAEGTILHLAVKHDDWLLVDALLSAGVRADLVDGNGRKPLHCLGKTYIEICFENKWTKKTLEQLLLATNEIDLQNSLDRTALYWAAFIEDWDLMKFLLDLGDRPHMKIIGDSAAIHLLLHDVRGRGKYSPPEGNNPVLKQLVEASEDVNLQDSQGRTALHVAALLGQWDLMKLLLDSGARADIKDEYGDTAIHCLTLEGSDLEINSLSEDVKLVWKQLMEAEEDVNLRDFQGRTALHTAACNRNWDLMKLLLDSGARADIKDEDGDTAIHCLVKKYPYHLNNLCEDKKLVLKQLMAAAKDVNLQDSQGRTALHVTAFIGQWDLMKLLLDGGARADTKDKDGDTVIHHVLAQYHPCDMDYPSRDLKPVLKQLVEAMDNVNLQDCKGRTLLHIAGSIGEWDLMKFLLNSEARADIKDGDGYTAIDCFFHGFFFGCRNFPSVDRKPLWKQLVEATDDINLQDSQGRTVLLHTAASAEDLDLQEHLLDCGARADIVDKNKKTIFHYLRCHPCLPDAKAMHERLFQKLLEHVTEGTFPTSHGDTEQQKASSRTAVTAAEVLNSQDVLGRTALHCAASENDVTKAELLLHYGARLHVQDREGKTPLHCASSNGSDKVAELLLSHGANPNLQDSKGRTPLHHIASRNESIFGESNTIVNPLLRYGAKLDLQDGKGDTALHHATSEGNCEVAKLLLSHGANPNVQNKEGTTSLHNAALLKDETAVRLLLSHGANPNVQNKEGTTSLHNAASVENETTLRLLLSHGANPNVQNKEGKTALHNAALLKDKTAVRLLLSHGANPNVQNREGKTALHYVASVGDEIAVRRLLYYGARPDLKDKEGRTPWQVRHKSWRK